MSFFRRDKEDDRQSIDDYRRSREVLTPKPRGSESPFTMQDEENNTVDRNERSYQSEPSHQESTPAQTEQAKWEKYRAGATMVAKDTSFKGSLATEGNLFIEGNFDGQLEARSTIVIAEGATVKADVRATDVIIAGILNGTVDASNRFHAMPTAQVTGEINSAVLVVEQGSTINCRFAMKTPTETRG